MKKILPILLCLPAPAWGISSTSIFEVQSVANCDTTEGSATVSGCGDTSWLQAGMQVNVSAGFPITSALIVQEVTVSTITFHIEADSSVSDITVEQIPYYDPEVAANDVLEFSRSTSSGFEVSFDQDGDLVISYYSGTHTGSNGASSLTDSTESWLEDEHVGRLLENQTDGSSCVIESNTGTELFCSLSGGTDDDWDSGDSYRIIPNLLITDYMEIEYCIQDVSDATDGAFTNPSCWPEDDKIYVNDIRPEWDDFGTIPLLLYVGMEMEEIDLTEHCEHANGHTLSFTTTGTVPTGTTVSSAGIWSGTPNAEDEMGETIQFRCINEGLLASLTSRTVYVTDDEITVPDLVGEDEETADEEMVALRPWLGIGQVVSSLVCGTEENEGEIVSHSPAASETIDATTPLQINISRGLCLNPEARGRRTNGMTFPGVSVGL